MQSSGYEPDNSDAETQLVGGSAQPSPSPEPAAPGTGQPPVPPTAVAQPYPPPAGTYPAAQPATPGSYEQPQQQYPPSYPDQGYPQQPGYGTPAPGYGTPAPGYGTPAPGYGTPTPGGYGTPAPEYGQQAQQPGYDYSQGQQAYPGYPQQPGYGTPAPGYDYSQQPGYAPPPGYGPGGYPGTPQPPRNNNRRNLIIGAVAAGVVVIILIVVLAVTLSGGGDKPTTNPTASPTTTVAPSTSVPTTAPTTTTPTPTAAGTALNANEQALVNQLDPTSMTDCDPAPDQENADIQAAVLCMSDDGRGVYAFSYVNKAALDHDSSFYSNSIDTNGDCENGKDQVTTWSYDDDETDQGALLCSHTSDGSAYIRWYYDNQLLGFFATDQDGAALYTWWRNFEAVQQ